MPLLNEQGYKIVESGSHVALYTTRSFSRILEDFSKCLGGNSTNFLCNPVFQFLYRIHQRSKNTVLKMTPQKVVWRTEFWTPQWPDACGNDTITEKVVQKLECLSWDTCRRRILLKPRYTSAIIGDVKVIGPMIRLPNKEVFWMEPGFLIQVGVFTAPHSKIPRVDVACPVKPGLCETRPNRWRRHYRTQWSSDCWYCGTWYYPTFGIEEPDDQVAEVHIPARIRQPELLNHRCGIQEQFQFFKREECDCRQHSGPASQFPNRRARPRIKLCLNFFNFSGVNTHGGWLLSSSSAPY